jgi:hypothetical protein
LSTLNTTISSANFNTSDKTIQLYGKVVPDATLPTSYYALATTNPSLTPDQVRTLIEAGSAAVYDATHDDFSAGTITVPKVMDLTGVVYDSSAVNYANVYLYGTDGVHLKHDALSSKTIAPRSENKLVYDFGSMTLTTVAAPGMTESSFVALSDNYYMVGDRGNGTKKYIYRINETTPYQTITESLFWNLAMTDLYFICSSASAYKMYYRDTSDIWTEFHSKTTGVVGEYDSDIYDKTAVIQTSTGLDIITIVPGATQDDAPTVTTETIRTNTNGGCYRCRIYENTIVYVDNLTKTMHVWERLDSTSQWVEIKTFINTNIGGVSLYKDTLTRKANSPLAAALHVYDRVNGTWNDTPSSTLTLPGTTYGHTTSIHEEFIIVGNNGAGDAALYKRVNGVWGTTHTAVDYGSFEPWDVKIRNNIILIGRAASFYKYEGTTTVVPPELGPFVTITNVSSAVTPGVLTVTGTVFSGFANVTGGVRAAVFDPASFDLAGADQSALASFVNANGTDLGITSDQYAVGSFTDFSLSTYFSNIDAGYTTGPLVDGTNYYRVAVSAMDSTGNIGVGVYTPPFGTSLINYTSLSRATLNTIGSGWTQIKYLPGGSTSWFPGNDNLLNYGGTEFLFTTGDFSRWLVCDQFQVNGEVYGSNVPRTIKRSSISASPYQAEWTYRGTGYPWDPYISLEDHSVSSVNGTIMYGENSIGIGPLGSIHSTGMYVFVR